MLYYKRQNHNIAYTMLWFDYHFRLFYLFTWLFLKFEAGFHAIEVLCKTCNGSQSA